MLYLINQLSGKCYRTDKMERHIVMVKQNGAFVNLFDEKGLHIINVRGELHSYTPDTVTVKDGDMLKVYDIKGYMKFSRRA